MKVQHKEFEDYIKDNYFCNSILSSSRASISLLAILRAWKKNGYVAKIALSPNVCHEVFVSILKADFIPIFVDLDPSTGKVPITEWKRAKNNGASVALVVHLYGIPSDVDEVTEIFDATDNLVIDDAAQAIGAKCSEKNCGSMGNVGLLSFGNKKQISTGGAITLFKDPAFSREVEFQLAIIDKIDFFENNFAINNFISHFNRGRKQVREKNNTNLKFLHNILLNYNLISEGEKSFDPVSTLEELKKLNQKIIKRQTKCLLWKQNLNSNKFIPMNFFKNSSPWRFAFKVENISWNTQYKLSEEIRKFGIHVSNWYIPIHWMYKSKEKLNLEGTEKLSREIFQLWIDEDISKKEIIAQSKIINKIIETI